MRGNDHDAAHTPIDGARAIAVIGTRGSMVGRISSGSSITAVAAGPPYRNAAIAEGCSLWCGPSCRFAKTYGLHGPIALTVDYMALA